MVYYCSSNDVGSRLGLNNAQRTQAASKLILALRRATIDIDQEFRDYGRTTPSREIGETTLNGIVEAGAISVVLTSGNNFTSAGNGNIDGDSFSWTGKNGGVSALTIANAGANYQAGTLSATGGTGSGFTGTYGISATTASYSIGGTNTTAQAGNILINGVSKGAYTINAVVASVSIGGDNTGASAGNFTLNGAAGGSFAVNGSGAVTGFTISSSTKFPSVPTIAASSGSLGNGTFTAVLSSTGQIQAISVSDTTKYTSTPTVTSSSSFGNATISAVLNNTGIISSTVISAAGVYTVAPTAIVISHSGDSNASITSAFTYTKLTGISNISADHASGVAVQEGEFAHVLREICADLAAAYYMEDEGGTINSEKAGAMLRDRGTVNLKRLAHLGSVD